MQKRWEYVGHTSWVPGENIPALVKGGAQGGHSLNAAGLQFFGNCVTNLGKVPPELRQRLYMELSGRHTVRAVDVVTLVSILGGVSSKTARSWHNALDTRGWASAFQHGDLAGESFEVAVGTSDGVVEDVEDALPTLPMNEEIAMTDRDQELDRYSEGRPPEIGRAHV